MDYLLHGKHKRLSQCRLKLYHNRPSQREIQGSAADILKMAMIELDREMRERKFKANLLLQVHDELIFEVPQDELESLQSLVEEVMENAVSLKVPLRADSNVGDNWFEAK